MSEAEMGEATTDLPATDLPATGQVPPEFSATDLDDEIFDVAQRSPIGRLTPLLLAGIVAAAGFGAGVLVQKSNDRSLVSGSGQRSAARGAGIPGVLNGGGFGGTGSPSTGGGSTAGGSTSGGGSAPVLVLVGQVTAVRGTTLTVRNLGGATFTVTFAPGASLTLPVGTSIGTLAPGSTVAIAGTKTGSTVSATSVIVRS